MHELERKDVSDELIQKVINFAKLHETFTTKELFQEFPNNPELLLRYALNNLRIDNRIQMYGDKKGAYYSLNLNLRSHVSDTHVDIVKHKTDNSGLKVRIMEAATKHPGWFTRPDLGIEDVCIPKQLEVIQELIKEDKLKTQGDRRWTQYILSSIKDIPPDDKNEIAEDVNYNLILNFIKKYKVVTIPILISELELQRNDIIPVLNKLCSNEEIWHEGIKKSSKYIYKDVDSNGMDQYLAKLNETRKLDQRIDVISQFLINDNACAIIIGANKNGEFEIKYMDSANMVKCDKYNDLNDCLHTLKQMTEIVNE